MKYLAIIVLFFSSLAYSQQVIDLSGETAIWGGQVINLNGVSGGEETTWPELMLADFVSKNNLMIFTQTQQDSILNRLNDPYVVSTFGPDGLDKDVCDFFLYMETDRVTAMTERPVTNLGDTLLWNYGYGDTIRQDNLPAEICQSGVITATCVNGIDSITSFSPISTDITLISGLYYMSELKTFNYSNNSILKNPNLYTTNTEIVNIYGNGNNIDSISSYIGDIKVMNFPFNTDLVHYDTISIANSATLISFGTCALSSSKVNEVLEDIDACITTPTANLTITLNGGSMGSLPDGASNTFLLSLESKYSGAGRTLTVNYETP